MGEYVETTGRTIGAIRAGRIEARYQPLPVDTTWDPDRDRYPAYGHRRPLKMDQIEAFGDQDFERRTSNGCGAICPACQTAMAILTGECKCGSDEERAKAILRAAGVDIPLDPPKVPGQPALEMRRAGPILSATPAGGLAPKVTTVGRWGTVLFPFVSVTHYWTAKGTGDMVCNVLTPVCDYPARRHVEDWKETRKRWGHIPAKVTEVPNVPRCRQCVSQIESPETPDTKHLTP